MTRDEIYDHLAQVYLGKKNKSEIKIKRQFNAWLVINIGIAAIILASTFYGLSAFLTQRGESFQSRIVFALNNGPIRINYNLGDPYPPVKVFSLSVPQMDAHKYTRLNFSIRGFSQGYPGIVKVVLRNKKNEEAIYFAKDVETKWKTFSVPFEEFEEISDWTVLKDVSFVFESWNVEKVKGVVLIDDVSFGI